MRCAGWCLIASLFAMRVAILFSVEQPNSTSPDSLLFCYYEEHMAQSKSEKDQNAKPSKLDNAFTEIVKIMANTPLVSNDKLAKRGKKRKG
jgi:hypothetical protein